jgi:phosphohistidine phosphatase
VPYADRLYSATPATVIDEINAVDDEVNTLLVIGHEPVISEVAISLAGADGTDTAAAERISAKFPTSAIAVLRVRCRWQRLEPRGAALVGFHVPR